MADAPPVVDPADLPTDTPQSDDGNDRDNDIPTGDEKP